MNIHTLLHKTDSSFENFVTDIMRKRVSQGYPEEISLSFKGVYKAFSWTDGLNSIVSIFTPIAENWVKEISVDDS